MIIVGLVLLTAVAAVIGLAVERDARARAWRRIAEERRWNWDRRSGAVEGQDPATP